MTTASPGTTIEGANRYLQSDSPQDNNGRLLRVIYFFHHHSQSWTACDPAQSPLPPYGAARAAKAKGYQAKENEFIVSYTQQAPPMKQNI